MFDGFCSRHVEDTEKTLVPFLKLSVVKNLDSDHRRMSDGDVKMFVPSGAQRLSHDSCCAGLLAINS
jgi:hypothetical protein